MTKLDIELQHVQRWLTVGGQKVRVEVHPGKGTPILICNGLGANLELLEPLTRALSGVPLILFDLPGTGASPAPYVPYRMRGYARLVAGMLDQLDIDVVHLLGISWGGALVQQFARSYPNRVSRLVLASSSPGSIAIPSKPSSMLSRFSRKRYLNSKNMEEAAPKIYGGMVRAKPQLLKHLTSQMRPPTRRGYLYQLFASMGWTSVLWLPKIKHPALIMTGDDDPLVATGNSKLLFWLLPYSTLHIVKDGGHLFLLARPNESASVITRFLHEPLDIEDAAVAALHSR